MRVQLPLGALDEQDVGKPGIPRASGARERGFKSRRPDLVSVQGRSSSFVARPSRLPKQAGRLRHKMTSIAVGPVLVRAGAC